MILGLGSDIIENARIEQLYKCHKKRFLKRIFTEEECQYAFSHKDPIPYLAVRFSAKEAAVKALNLQERRERGFFHKSFGWKDIEISGKDFGKKKLVFHNQAHNLAEKLKIKHKHLSLSHCDTFSIATVILED